MSPNLPESITSITDRDDPWSVFACFDETLVIRRLDEVSSSSASGSTRSLLADVFSNHGPTVVTQPTSNGTNYIWYNQKHGENTEVTHATSLSAFHGSVSEEEIDSEDLLQAALIGTGAWVPSRPTQGQCLRRHENAKIRLSKDLPRRRKKPMIVLHQVDREPAAVESVTALPTNTTPAPAMRSMLVHMPYICCKSNHPQDQGALLVACLDCTALCLYGFALRYSLPWLLD